MRPLLALILLLAAAEPAAAATRSQVYFRAEAQAVRASAACREARIVTTPPHPALTGLVSVLRREPTAADALRADLATFPGQRVYGAHVRLARTFEGERLYLVAFKRMLTISHPQRAACRRAIVRAVRRRAPRLVAYARRRAAREGRLAAFAPDVVEVVDDSLVVGQGVTARKLGLSGGWSAAGDAVRLLLPDAVRSVRAHHGDFVAEAAVEANLAIYRVPARRDTEPDLVEWLDASGAVIRRVDKDDAAIVD